MNSLYIGIGTAIIMAFLTALVGPLFVDWSLWRGTFEAESSAIVGLPVRVLGDVDARLLPSPRIRFGDVVIGDLDHPTARIGRFELDLEAAPLLKGERRVSELRLDRASLDLILDADGRLTGPRPVVVRDLAEVAIEAVRLVDGRVTILDRRSGRSGVATGIAAQGALASLAGPWRLEGAAEIGGRATTIRLTGVATGEGASVRLGLGFPDDPALSVGFDTVMSAPEGRPRLAGTASVERRADASGRGGVKASAALAGDAAGIDLTDVAILVGPEDLGARFTGKGRARFGAETLFALDLAARRIDLDGLMGEPVTPERAVRAVVAALAAGWTGGPVPIEARVAVEAATMGGATVRDVEIAARARGGVGTLERFAAVVPGEGKVVLSGRFDLADGIGFTGRGEASSEDPALTFAWARNGAVVGEALPPVAVSGRFALAAGELRGEEMEIAIGATRARGRATRTPSGALSIGLEAARLDLDQWARLAQGLGVDDVVGALEAAPALEIELDVGTVSGRGVTARGVGVTARSSRERLELDRLTIEDLAGARIGGSGRIEAPGRAPVGTIDLTVAAERPAGAARAVVGVIAPGAAEGAALIGETIGPIDLAVGIEGRGAAGDGRFAVGVKGRAAGGEISGAGTFDGVFGEVDRIGIDGRLVLLGARARLTATAEGALAGGLAIDLDATVGEARGRIEGRVTRAAATGFGFEGRAEIGSPDASGLAALIGRPGLAFERRLPVALTVTGAVDAEEVDVGSVAGRIGDVGVSGALRVRREGERRRTSGRLDFDRVEIGAIAEALAATVAGNGLVGDGDVDLRVASERLALGERSIGGPMAARLSSSDGVARIEGVRGRLVGGDFEGSATVRRAEAGGAAFAVRGRLAGARLPGVAKGASGLEGVVSGEFEIEARGEDADRLAETISGTARIEIGEGRLVGLEARFAPPEPGPSAAAQAKARVARMTTGMTALPPFATTWVIDRGAATAVRTDIVTEEARLAGRTTIGVVDGALRGDWTIEAAGVGARRVETPTSKARPSVGVRLDGRIDAPEVRVDPAPLAAQIDLFRLEDDIDKAEAVRADMVERARFARELRRIEERAREREAARRAAEAERARAAEQPGPEPIRITPPLGAIGPGGSDAAGTAPGAIAPQGR